MIPLWVMGCVLPPQALDPQQEVMAVQAAFDLEAGHVLHERDLVQVRVDAALLPRDDGFTAVEPLVGRALLEPVFAHELLVSTRVGGQADNRTDGVGAGAHLLAARGVVAGTTMDVTNADGCAVASAVAAVEGGLLAVPGDVLPAVLLALRSGGAVQPAGAPPCDE